MVILFPGKENYREEQPASANRHGLAIFGETLDQGEIVLSVRFSTLWARTAKMGLPFSREPEEAVPTRDPSHAKCPQSFAVCCDVAAGVRWVCYAESRADHQEVCQIAIIPPRS